jgi:hypothetical protein
MEVRMMKSILLVGVLVPAMAVLGTAQTTPDVYPQVHASTMVPGGANGGVRLSGDVDFTLGISTLGTTHIRADEAIISASHDVELRGNVHLITGTDAGKLRLFADSIR